MRLDVWVCWYFLDCITSWDLVTLCWLVQWDSQSSDLGILPYTGPLWGAPSLWGVREKILGFSLAFFFLIMFFFKDSAWLESHVWEKTTFSTVRRDMFPFCRYMKWAFIQWTSCTIISLVRYNHVMTYLRSCPWSPILSNRIVWGERKLFLWENAFKIISSNTK